MIIKLLPKKDTYVSNLKTQFNDASIANVGQASTIDLFKIVSKNKNVFAAARLTFSGNPVAGNSFILCDGENTAVTFQFGNGAGQINIGNTVATISNLINVVNANAIKITAFKLTSNKVAFVQDVSGPNGVKNNSKVGDNIAITNFKQFEHSAGLLNFPIDTFKSENVVNLANSVFNSPNDFKACIKLTDVGNANTRPRDFSINLSPLSGSFKEGLGKDILHFSDEDDANFEKLDSKNNITWTKKDFVLHDDLFYSDTFVTYASASLVEGDEDLSFNITGYFKDQMGADVNNENFVIYFNEENLFDDYDYFVKRLGSRHLRNKKNAPYLEIKIKDSKIYYLNNEDKKRYLDNEEKFYLKNIINGKLTDFLSPSNNEDNVKLDIFLGNVKIGSTISGAKIYDFKGNEITGIKKFDIANNVLKRSNSNFTTALSTKNYVELTLKYYYESGETADLGDDLTIREDKVKFYIPESVGEISTKNLRSTINLQQKSLNANNTIEFLKVSFIDIEKQYDAVKTPAMLVSENIGDVYYSMYDVDSGEELIEFVDTTAEKGFTQMHFNGDEYILNLYCSELYKDKRVNFKFYYTDVFSGKQKQVFDSAHIVRFK